MIKNKIIKNYFYKYRKVENKIYELKLEIEEIDKTGCTLKNNTNNDVKVTSKSSNNGLETILETKEKLIKQLDKCYNQKNKLRRCYLKDFDNLSNILYKVILTDYYLNRSSLKDISNKIDKSLSYTKKLKKVSLKELENIIKK